MPACVFEWSVLVGVVLATIGRHDPIMRARVPIEKYLPSVWYRRSIIFAAVKVLAQIPDTLCNQYKIKYW